MIMNDIRADGCALLQINGRNYGLHITDVEHEFGFGSARMKLKGEVMDAFRASNSLVENRKSCAIERVIFNDPATIVIWSDNTKTVVKCQPGDTYDPEKGLALCVCKRFLGNKGNFNNEFKKWIPESPSVIDDLNDDVIRVGSKVNVVRDGYVYPDYADWVSRHVINSEDRRKWRKGVTRNGDIGRVKVIAQHGGAYDGGVIIAYVDFGTHCSMIDIEGLKKIKRVKKGSTYHGRQFRLSRRHHRYLGHSHHRSGRCGNAVHYRT